MLKAALVDNAHLALTLQCDAALFYHHLEADRERYETWLSWGAKIADEQGAREFIESYLAKLAANNGLLLGIWVDGIMAGGVLLRTIDWDTRRTEVGFWIAERFSGRGLVTRATAALLDFAFDTMKLDHVTLQAATTNLPSRAVAERLGFTLEGTLRHAHAYPAGVLDHAVYGLLANEWRCGSARTKYQPLEAL